MLEAIWWFLLLVVFYVYFAYPALLCVLSRSRGKRAVPIGDDFEPTVSLIVAAYNEEQVVAQKLENSLALDFPRDRIEIILVSDGSTDETAEVVHAHKAEGIRLLDLPQNVGKASAQNQAVKQATGDILLFTDANVSLQRDAVRKLLQHFRDDKVGCAVGKVTYLNEAESGISEGEGFYWRYELFVRQKESEIGNLLAGSGPIIAVRRELFEPLDPGVSEDFVLPMRVAIKGYRTLYEPEAVTSERLFQVSPESMFLTKARTIALDTRGVFLCRAILNPFRYPLYAWGLVSHKLLRWSVPYLLVALFALNLVLLTDAFYSLAMVLQLSFYSLALAGWLWHRRGKPPHVLGIPLTFCVVNLAALMGTGRFIVGKRAGQWEPVR